MKTLIASILVLSSMTAFAAYGVLDAFRTIFHEGTYQGQTMSNEACSLNVQILADRAVITASTDSKQITRTILAGTGYRMNYGIRQFLSSDKIGTFRSLAVDSKNTYTVTAVPLAEGGEDFVECIVPTVE